MSGGRTNGTWVIWLTLMIALLLSIAPMPFSAGLGRPLWLAMVISYWAIALPHRGAMVAAFVCSLMLDVLSGTLLGQNGLPLLLVTFLVLSLQQPLRMFPLMQQSLVLMVINTLTGNRPPPLLFLVPVPVSALLWPWLFMALHWMRRRFNVY